MYIGSRLGCAGVLALNFAFLRDGQKRSEGDLSATALDTYNSSFLIYNIYFPHIILPQVLTKSEAFVSIIPHRMTGIFF